MFNDDELNGLLIRAKVFWQNFDKNSVINDFHQCTHIHDHRKYESSFISLHNFFVNIVDPYRIFEAAELRVAKLKESLDFYCEEFETLKRNDTMQKKMIDDLQIENDKLTHDLSNYNKTISSYQHIQLRHLHEIDSLKRALAEARQSVPSDSIKPQEITTTTTPPHQLRPSPAITPKVTTNILKDFFTTEKIATSKIITSESAAAATPPPPPPPPQQQATTSTTAVNKTQPTKEEIINTFEISKTLNELLKTNRFSINDFKSIFDISYQTIDDILNRPKPWSILSQRIKIVHMKIARNLKNIPELAEKINNLDKGSTISNSSSDDDDDDDDHGSSDTDFDDEATTKTRCNKRQKVEHFSNQPMIEYNTNSLKITYLDTMAIIQSVKKRLRDLELTQRVFARALFDTIGQEIFQFRPWIKTGERNRGRMIKMYMWLNDPFGGQKLKDYDEGKYDPKNYENENNVKPLALSFIPENQDEDIIVLEDE